MMRRPLALLCPHLRVLGLSGPRSSVTDDEIKQAYRAMVKLHHPDATGATADSTKFREVQAAYEELLSRGTSSGGGSSHTQPGAYDHMDWSGDSPRGHHRPNVWDDHGGGETSTASMDEHGFRKSSSSTGADFASGGHRTREGDPTSADFQEAARKQAEWERNSNKSTRSFYRSYSDDGGGESSGFTPQEQAVARQRGRIVFYLRFGFRLMLIYLSCSAIYFMAFSSSSRLKVAEAAKHASYPPVYWED